MYITVAWLMSFCACESESESVDHRKDKYQLARLYTHTVGRTHKASDRQHFYGDNANSFQFVLSANLVNSIEIK